MTDAYNRVRIYNQTIDRMEPDIAAVDAGAYYASAAISLKRIADFLGARIGEVVPRDKPSIPVECWSEELRKKWKDWSLAYANPSLEDTFLAGAQAMVMVPPNTEQIEALARFETFSIANTYIDRRQIFNDWERDLVFDVFARVYMNGFREGHANGH